MTTHSPLIPIALIAFTLAYLAEILIEAATR